MFRTAVKHVAALAFALSAAHPAFAQKAAAPPEPATSAAWGRIGALCAATARTKPTGKALEIARIAKDEFYYFGGHRIDSHGRLFSFGVIESEQEESEENITTYRLGHLGWWQVLRYWRALAEAGQPIDAARRYLRLRGFADATAEPDDKDLARPDRMALARALEAIDKIDSSMQLTQVEKEIMKEALIRAAINDVAWSAAFISAVMRQAGLTEREFDFSQAHDTYIYKAFETALEELAGSTTDSYYRACPLIGSRPRPGDLVCYHRHERRHGTKKAAEIRGLILDDLSAKPEIPSIHKSHCDVVAHVDLKVLRVYVVGGNVQQAVTVKKLVLRRRDGSLAEVQPDGCKIDGGWTFPKVTPGQPVAPHYSEQCSLNRKHWFVLLQARR